MNDLLHAPLHPAIKTTGFVEAADERARAVAAARRIIATAPAYDPEVVILARQFLRAVGVPA